MFICIINTTKINLKKINKTLLVIIYLIVNTINSQSGAIDVSFDPGLGSNGVINTICLQSDSKIIIGGDFTNFNGTALNRISRLDSSGNLDPSFTIGTGCNGWIQAIALHTNGKIVIVGGFTTYNGVSKKYIAQLNTDGTLDTSFSVGSGTNFPILAVAIQSDGKIIIGGGFTNYNGTNVNRILRLNTDGTIDTTFVVGTGVENSISTINIQTNGKIIIGGEFTTYNGTPINRLARLNTDGTLDTSFNVGTGVNNAIWCSKIQTDGKLIIGGLFTMYNGTSMNYIARLNSDGSIDTSFSIGIGANNGIRSLAYQFNDKVIFGGNYTLFNSSSSNRISRLHTNGNQDNTFNSGTAANNSVNAIAVQPDGNIIIAGNFTSYNGTAKNRIARIIGDTTLGLSDFLKNKVSIYPNPCSNLISFSIENNSNVEKYEIFDVTGKIIIQSIHSNTNQIDVSNLSKGIYFLSIFNENKNYIGKFIKTN